MSNGRKFRRGLGAAALGTATLATGLAFSAGSALAAAPTTFTAAGPTAANTPSIYPGLSNQPAGNVSLTLSNTFSAGDKIVIPILKNGAPNDASATDSAATAAGVSVTFSAAPTVAASTFTTTPTGTTAGNTSDTAPAITTSLVTNPADGPGAQNGGLKDELVITFGNSATGTAGDAFTLKLSAIQYNAGASSGSTSNTAVNVQLAPSYQVTTPASSTPSNPPTVTNAFLQNFTVTETPTGVPTGSAAQPLGALAVAETVPGTLAPTTSAAPASVAPLASTVVGNTPNANNGAFVGTATVTVTGFTVAAAPTSGNCPAATTGGVTTLSVPATNGVYNFCIVTNTSGAGAKPGSITVSGITYNAPTTVGPVDVNLTAPTTAGGTFNYSTQQPAITVTSVPRIAGQTADDTAVAAAVQEFGQGTINGDGGAVILASDAGYQDALSAAYLGKSTLPYQRIGRGGSSSQSLNPILLNPPTPPAAGESTTAAANQIRKFGASTVYLIGGINAISPDVATQLSQTQIGTTSTGAPQYLQVIRIAGTTAQQTAAQVAQYPSSVSGTLPNTPGAYGAYNSGASGSANAPSGTAALKTAILADSDDFRDALAASSLSYNERLPVLLNGSGQGLDPAASAAINNLGIQQVIVVGGSAAVSDTAVANLIAQGVSVLRIAGTTFTTTAQQLASFILNKNTAAPAAGSTATQQVNGLNSPASVNGPSLTVGTSRGDAYQDALASAQVLGGGNYGNIDPLLLNVDVNNIGTGTAAVLTTDGTGPNGGLVINNAGTSTTTEHILGNIVFGGTGAQTPALVQTELNDIAAG